MPARLRLACPTCGPTSWRAWIRQAPAWRLYACGRCGLAVTWPRPEAGQLRQAYDAAYYEERGMGAAAAQAWRERADEFLARLGSRPESVLDWGAGLGHLVAELRMRGIDAEGVERSATAREAALRVNRIELAPVVPEGRRYAVASLYHSLEHVEDPLGLLQSLREAVQPDGRLFVEVPHVRSADMLLPSRRRQILSLPHHLFHFTPPSLRALLEAAGYEVLQTFHINSWLVEAALAWRARAMRAASARPAAAQVVAVAPPPRAGRVRRVWAGRLLPWLREACPGWRFQILARPLT